MFKLPVLLWFFRLAISHSWGEGWRSTTSPCQKACDVHSGAFFLSSANKNMTSVSPLSFSSASRPIWVCYNNPSLFLSDQGSRTGVHQTVLHSPGSLQGGLSHSPQGSWGRQCHLDQAQAPEAPEQWLGASAGDGKNHIYWATEFKTFYKDSYQSFFMFCETEEP